MHHSLMFKKEQTQMNVLVTANKTVELFSAHSIADEYCGYNDVKFNWFNTDRTTPVAPYESLIEGYEPTNGLSYAEGCVNELFTKHEVELLRVFLKRSHNSELHVKAVDLPISSRVAGYSAMAVGGGTDFYMLDQTPGYDLPFRVHGYFDLGVMEFLTLGIVDGELRWGTESVPLA